MAGAWLQLRQLPHRIGGQGAVGHLLEIVGRPCPARCVSQDAQVSDDDQEADRRRGDLFDYDWRRLRHHPGGRWKLGRPCGHQEGYLRGWRNLINDTDAVGSGRNTAASRCFSAVTAMIRKVAGFLRDLAISVSARVLATAITNGGDANDGAEGR